MPKTQYGKCRQPRCHPRCQTPGLYIPKWINSKSSHIPKTWWKHICTPPESEGSSWLKKWKQNHFWGFCLPITNLRNKFGMWTLGAIWYETLESMGRLAYADTISIETHPSSTLPFNIRSAHGSWRAIITDADAYLWWAAMAVPRRSQYLRETELLPLQPSKSPALGMIGRVRSGALEVGNLCVGFLSWWGFTSSPLKTVDPNPLHANVFRIS